MQRPQAATASWRFMRCQGPKVSRQSLLCLGHVESKGGVWRPLQRWKPAPAESLPGEGAPFAGAVPTTCRSAHRDVEVRAHVDQRRALQCGGLRQNAHCLCVCVCRELPRVNSFWPEQQHSLRPTSQSFQSISSCDLRVSRVCSHRVHTTRTYESLPWLLWLLAAPGRMRTIQVRRMLGCPRL